ncbi:MAG: hypothetical protein A3C27_01450 [Candidatus Levybacteria bacterium RIFCSPHIGHO2_02_FULL_39_36]|nr:MAG: hypothetical protein UT20_C0020G0007 [Candidatus Levybacteria bacterium GW2011_GWA1_39_11]KKR49323.1 MAG: hypothetical protein UT85_C0024G0007 [Candidatus Levybacteria bacterium GW2011_GWA2_40_16]OGH15083.1 MAG: hypothetical protein A2689_00295 [Candidatus Levybacteria bacterium RIFCSPHIGHO2_01_FULL_38_96]OGH25989.1 MAG: hypothetical protein A3E68_01435 [Candidatus Levybacteria bacterium RIFCSPHIGHO2_12_FULL_39_39]OGH27326.1 MAG: hypothetical protein A3C27_01450 [Candidatus Levybacteria
MDPKKNLTPELKQIYDRVMNTQVKKPENPTETPSGPITNPVPSPIEANVTPSPLPSQEPIQQPSPNPAAPSPINTAPTNEAFLSSVPPRPLTDTKPFVFTGNKISSPQVKTETGNQAHVSQNKKLSGKIVAMFVVVLIVIWTLIWAKFFGLL